MSRRVQDKKCTWLVAPAPAEQPSPHHVGMAATLLSQGFLMLFSWAQATAELQGHPSWLHAEAAQALDPITKLGSAPHPLSSVFCVDMGSPPLSKVVVCLLLWLQRSTTAMPLQESSFQPPEAWSAGVQRAPAAGGTSRWVVSELPCPWKIPPERFWTSFPACLTPSSRAKGTEEAEACTTSHLPAKTFTPSAALTDSSKPADTCTQRRGH